MFLTDLLDKVTGKCEIINTNTDGVLVKLYNASDRQTIVDICEKWCKRTRFELEYDDYVTVIQKDVNNYIIIDKDDNVKRKGSYVKKLSALDNDLPIVNRAIVNYLVHHIPVETTVNMSNKLIDFQKITKIGRQYEYVFKENLVGKSHKYTKIKKSVKKGIRYDNVLSDDRRGAVLSTRVNRCFASNLERHGMLLKKKIGKTSLDKIASTPDKCYIDNSNITEKRVPPYLDRQWYIDLANHRINEFI